MLGSASNLRSKLFAWWVLFVYIRRDWAIVLTIRSQTRIVASSVENCEVCVIFVPQFPICMSCIIPRLFRSNSNSYEYTCGVTGKMNHFKFVTTHQFVSVRFFLFVFMLQFDKFTYMNNFWSFLSTFSAKFRQKMAVILFLLHELDIIGKFKKLLLEYVHCTCLFIIFEIIELSQDTSSKSYHNWAKIFMKLLFNNRRFKVMFHWKFRKYIVNKKVISSLYFFSLQKIRILSLHFKGLKEIETYFSIFEYIGEMKMRIMVNIWSFYKKIL